MMDSRHRTPLHIAIEWGYTATIQLLDSRSPYGVRRSGFGDRQPCKYNLRGATLSKPR
ncbi:hypothetical protein L873DRAFT_1811859 [Choiromyces venosus 120613-1]|uniref:Ankyrin n=1 Tax=Choiromyces venosus 120613-1 TaxID=1336337 RepID=A0A3N4JGV8_9PEZI|nr:hypothetical protein L873DRAFT_1811859 [Choiromyces venosus 120613-1]